MMTYIVIAGHLIVHTAATLQEADAYAQAYADKYGIDTHVFGALSSHFRGKE